MGDFIGDANERLNQLFVDVYIAFIFGHVPFSMCAIQNTPLFIG